MVDLILEKLKILLAAYPSIVLSDDMLTMIVERELDNARGYCNRSEMPESSAGTIAFMCLDELRDINEKNVKSVNEGGSSVSFGNLTNLEL